MKKIYMLFLMLICTFSILAFTGVLVKEVTAEALKVETNYIVFKKDLVTIDAYAHWEPNNKLSTRIYLQNNSSYYESGLNYYGVFFNWDDVIEVDVNGSYNFKLQSGKNENWWQPKTNPVIDVAPSYNGVMYIYVTGDENNYLDENTEFSYSVGYEDPSVTVKCHANYPTKTGLDDEVTKVTAISVNGKATAVVPNTTFECTGYEFAGWSTTPNGEKEYDNGDYVSSANDLYAVWTAKEEQVVFYNNYPVVNPMFDLLPLESDNSTALNTTALYDDTYTIPADPSYLNYKFTGWVNAEGELQTFKAGDSKNVTENEVYYAKWEQVLLVSLRLEYTYHYELSENVQYTKQTGYLFFTRSNDCNWDDVTAHVWNSSSSYDYKMTYLENNEYGQKVYVAYIGTDWDNVVFYNGYWGGTNQTDDCAINNSTSAYYMGSSNNGSKWSVGSWNSNWEVTVNIKVENLVFCYTEATNTNSSSYWFKLSCDDEAYTGMIKGTEDGKIYSGYDVTGFADRIITVSVYEGSTLLAQREISAQAVALTYLTEDYMNNSAVKDNLAAIIKVVE